MHTWIRILWLLASPLERFLLLVLPLTTIWDLFRGNWLDLVVGICVGTWIVWDVQRRGI